MYRSFDPSANQSGLQRGRDSYRAPAVVSEAIDPLYQELHLVTRQLRRGTTASKARARDASLVDALGRLDHALRNFLEGVDWAELRRNPSVAQRTEQILLAPGDGAQLERLGVVLDVDPETRDALLRDFNEAVAELGGALTTERDSAATFDQLRDHLMELSAEVTQARLAARTAMAGKGRATPEQRSAWRSLIIRLGRAVAVLALLLGVASDAYNLDDIARTGLTIWRQFAEAPSHGL